ncbi:hypothetical protein [Microcoleus vaginatus]|uniref:hypothetical protein n=1 Tax=Microcoleus vaginatus TaxID=119532 RepID=UPI00020D1D7F|nr:hypothetical protein MicvaDRAFT_3430 [Microcoleus vaginatus FGP-2]
MSVLIIKAEARGQFIEYNVERQYQEKVMSGHDALMLGLLLLPGLALSIAILGAFAAGG